MALGRANVDEINLETTWMFDFILRCQVEKSCEHNRFLAELSFEINLNKKLAQINMTNNLGLKY